MIRKISTSRGVINIDVPDTPTGNEFYMVCPICTSSRTPQHQRQKKFAVNLDPHDPKGYMMWRCNHCGEAGKLLDELALSKMPIKPLFKVVKKDPVTESFKKWIWDNRKITSETLEYFQIALSKENILHIRGDNEEMKGKYVNRLCMQFRYYKDKQLINIKFRDRFKNFKMITDATKIFYNIDSIKNQKYCIITEGEFDAMCYHQVGLTSVVSVPNGVTISDEEKEHYNKTGIMKVINPLNMEYLDLCIDDFKNIEIIYIATDDDLPGLKLRHELARRLGKERCMYIRFNSYKKNDKEFCKDPNEVLIYHGDEALKNTLIYAERFEITGIIKASSTWEELASEYDYGLEMGLSSGFKTLDPHFRWLPGWLYVGNGYPAEGKSTFWFNMIANSIMLYNWKWGIYAPENYPVKNIVNIFAEIFLGKSTNKYYNNRASRAIYEDVVKNIIDKHLFFMDDVDGFTPATLRKKSEVLIKNFGVNALFTDPWKNMKHLLAGRNIDQYLQDELNEEVRFTIKHNLYKVIIHHPPTPIRSKDKIYPPPSPFELIGGQIWFSTTYGMLCTHRNNKYDANDKITNIFVQKIKDQRRGGIPNGDEPIRLKFERFSQRFLENLQPSNTEAKWYSPLEQLMNKRKEQQLKLEDF